MFKVRLPTGVMAVAIPSNRLLYHAKVLFFFEISNTGGLFLWFIVKKNREKSLKV